MSAFDYSESPPWMTSPSSTGKNYNPSAAVSPGSWNVASPTSVMHGNYPVNTPTTACSPRYTTTHDFIGLPQNLGQPQLPAKSEFEIRRENDAQFQAQKLLTQEFGAQMQVQAPSPNPVSPSPSYNSYMSQESDDGGYAARMAAIQKYKEKKLIQQSNELGKKTKHADDNGASTRKAALARYKLKKEQERRGASPSQLSTYLPFEPRKEVLATTTRKKKVATEEEDYETINDYKCQYDIDREKEAEKKALNLLKELGM